MLRIHLNYTANQAINAIQGDTMAKVKKADPVKTEEKTVEYKLINLFKFRTLNNLASCEARDMKLIPGQLIVDPDDNKLGRIADIEARWLAINDVNGKTWVALDNFTLALQNAPKDARGKYLKRDKNNNPIKHGFAYCHVRVEADENGKATGKLIQE